MSDEENCDWGGCDREPEAGAFCNFHADEYERVVAERGKEWADD